MPAKGPLQSLQVFGSKKTATAVAHSKSRMIEPRTLQQKTLEPVILLGKDGIAGVDIRVPVKGECDLRNIARLGHGLSPHATLHTNSSHRGSIMETPSSAFPTLPFTSCGSSKTL
uniref:Uncharacterized protein n=1 Tax=Callorhinchus milii TaxID=7868 RepID=A0A4W3H5E6_CALMI